jgi:hypothetical protein
MYWSENNLHRKEGGDRDMDWVLMSRTTMHIQTTTHKMLKGLPLHLQSMPWRQACQIPPQPEARGAFHARQVRYLGGFMRSMKCRRKGGMKPRRKHNII